tara:strand:+ start:622 stop:1221 length:600 start_codon:yes stop_codon:yes gene_type:complete
MKFTSNISNKGFTLIEMLTSILIASGVTIFTFIVYKEIQNLDYLEHNKLEITNYSNKLLNEICMEIERAYSLSYIAGLNNRTIRTKYRKDGSNLDRIIHFNFATGITINDTVPVYHTFFPLDELGRKKYEVYDFKIEDVRVQYGDVLSKEGENARDASRDVSMNILLYSRENQLMPYDTLYFKRRVFSPALLITNFNNS